MKNVELTILSFKYGKVQCEINGTKEKVVYTINTLKQEYEKGELDIENPELLYRKIDENA